MSISTSRSRLSVPYLSVLSLALAVAQGCGDTRDDLDAGPFDPGSTGFDSTGGTSGGLTGGGMTGGATGGLTGGGTNGGTGSTGGGATNGGSTGATGGGGTTGAEVDNHPHQACVDRINELRATLSLPPLQRWTEAEGCSDMQSQKDHVSGVAHGNFPQCGEGGQNTCPDWRDQASIIGGCLDRMWAEGPAPGPTCDEACFQAHGHYLNMTNTEFTKVACGFYDDGAGAVWSNQNFK